jgi:hypothetical protein
MLRLPRLLSALVIFLLLTVPALGQQSVAVNDSRPAQALVAAEFPSVESVARIQGPLTFCGESVPLQLPDVRERIEKEILLMHWDRAQTLLWIKRTGRYFPHIESLLRANRMPDDLKYLPVIESALRLSVGSNRGARGIWQFIRSTGRKYGLEVDGYVDERRNFYSATKAAIRYLSDLHDQFKSWPLAAAAYNMGENGLEKAIKKQEIRDYYQLHLPTETERYVIRAIAAKMLLSNPDRYGFRLVPQDFYRPIRFDRIRLRCRGYTPLMLVAKAANTTYKNIRDLNPQFIRDRLPHGTHMLFIPEGAAKGFAERYKPLIEQYRAAHKGKVHRVRRGDTLLRIAQRYHMSLTKLLRLNNLTRKSTIHPGQTLIIRR